ncbi:FtsX-like permease family protein [Paenibacillus filicis]|uniref:FtsX-like permease family protein n=1 Tax=Paenibacillus filicis TaxID=669464 RepID=A0ABU9DUG6_9BACL
MLDINQSKKEIVDLITKFIGFISIFVAMILGFLIIYANHFLIRRRKKELGIYRTLGMGKNGISRILFTEILIIGTLSLGAGLLLGLFFSQGLSLFTATMFEVDTMKYRFIFSQSALLKTVGCFGIIFICVMLFNYVSISKYKLIDLLYASRKNESIKMTNKKLSTLLFFLSIMVLITAYILILRNGILEINEYFYGSMLLGAVGTFLFFKSLAGFAMQVVQSSGKVYFKNLIMFIARQINSKINTNFMTMAFICLMLFITIGILSSGLGINKGISKGLAFKTPYDATIRYLGESGNMTEQLQNHDIRLKDWAADYVEYKEYDTALPYDQLLDTQDLANLKQKTTYNMKFGARNLKAIRLTDYNKLMALQGKDTVDLGTNQYVLTFNQDDMAAAYSNFIKDKRIIKLGSTEFTPRYNHGIYVNIEVDYESRNYGTIVLQDHVVESLEPIPRSSRLSIQYKHNHNEEAANLVKGLLEKGPKDQDGYNLFHQISKAEVYASGQGLAMTFSFLGIYLGLVFLIASAAILALQQLSECADSMERYKLLRKIGAEEKMINKSIFIQIGIYFFTPLSLAVLHSVVGLKLAKDVVERFGTVSMASHIVFAAIFICIVYGGYFLATYIGARSMIKSSN